MESFFVDVGPTAFAVLGSRWHCRRRQQEQNEILLILKQACVIVLKIH